MGTQDGLPDSMRAAVFRGAEKVAIERIPVPPVGSRELLVKILANTICGTDTRIVTGSKTKGVRIPSVLGHEFVGRVAAVGAQVEGFTVGDAVAMAPVIPCLRCVNCREDRENICLDRRAMGYEFDGGMAEYVLVPDDALRAGNVCHVPETSDLERYALAEPLSCVLNGFERSGITMGDDVVILGAGPIGLLHTQLARNAGARNIVVSDLADDRLRVAEELGATCTVNAATGDLADRVLALTHGRGADATIMCIGVPDLLSTAVAVTRSQGTVNIFAGMPVGSVAALAANDVHYRELTITGTSAMKRRHFLQAVDLIARGVVDVSSLITHRVGLDDVAEALQVASSGIGLKVAVVP
jgi:L-iditol 2-dehydrogenase